MPFLFEDTESQRAIDRVWAGVIASNAVDFLDTVDVLIPEMSDSVRWEDCPWQARDNYALPQRGNDCIVVIDNDTKVTVVAWWPNQRSPTITTSLNSAGAPLAPIDGDIWIAKDADSAHHRYIYQWNATTNHWDQVYGTPFPVVNGQWIKGVGGIPVWSTITPADVGLPSAAAGLPRITSGAIGTKPTSPAFGDIWNFTSVNGSNGCWSFVWDGSRWEFTGGAPLLYNINNWGNVAADSTYRPCSGNITIPLSGTYLFTGTISWQPTTYGQFCVLGIGRNGSFIAQGGTGQDTDSSAQNTWHQLAWGPIPGNYNGGDTAQMITWMNGSGSPSFQWINFTAIPFAVN